MRRVTQSEACYKLIMFNVRLVKWIFGRPKKCVEEYTSTEKVNEEVLKDFRVKDAEELLPEFMQIISIDDNDLLGVEKIIMCPDRTALIRIVSDESFSCQYKRKLYTDKAGEFIKLNNQKYYIK